MQQDEYGTLPASLTGDEELKWRKDKRDIPQIIDEPLMKYPVLEKQVDDVQYMMNDCLKFRIHVTVVWDVVWDW